MESDSYFQILDAVSAIVFYPPDTGAITGIFVIIVLLIASALISGSELAYFSLTPRNKSELKKNKEKSSHRVLTLLTRPEKLLATILITNNFVNVGIVIISTFVTSSILDLREEPVFAFVFQVIIVTFLLLLFGEIIPKLFANQYPVRFAQFMSLPISILEGFFTPLSKLLIYSTSFTSRKLLRNKENFSIGDLSEALDLTTEVVPEEKHILKSIVKFGNIEVTDIMKPRMDIVAVEEKTKLTDVIEIINKSGYSRIPVFQETLDKVVGILYVKDLLAHLDKDDEFNWISLIRPSYFVPGTKKINALLQEFREKKIHLAVVVDEYGGTEGIVTLEDVLEEIVGEITDESDEIEKMYEKIDDKNYFFNAKVLLNDFYKTLQISSDIFADVKGDADTIAGLILELKGEIPVINEKINIHDFTFTIISSDKRRIKKVKVTIGSLIK